MKDLYSTKLLPSDDELIIEKKYYSKPRLERLGDLRTLTLGGSPGVGESGNPGVPRYPKTHGDFSGDDLF